MAAVAAAAAALGSFPPLASLLVYPSPPLSSSLNTLPTLTLEQRLSYPFLTLRPQSISPLAKHRLRCCCAASDVGAEEPEFSAIASGVKVEGGRDRRKVVRVAWEKIVRWSRSWRSRAKVDVLEKTKKVVVLGGGSFGTAMAAHMAVKKSEMEVYILVRDEHLCRSINHTHVNSKYFPNLTLPENIIATTVAKDALSEADYCFHAVPVQVQMILFHQLLKMGNGAYLHLGQLVLYLTVSCLMIFLLGLRTILLFLEKRRLS